MGVLQNYKKFNGRANRANHFKRSKVLQKHWRNGSEPTGMVVGVQILSPSTDAFFAAFLTNESSAKPMEVFLFCNLTNLSAFSRISSKRRTSLLQQDTPTSTLVFLIVARL